MSNAEPSTHTWPQLAAGLYDKLTGRNAEITYDFDDLHVHIPSSTDADAKQAHWRLQGVLKIRTRDLGAGS